MDKLAPYIVGIMILNVIFLAPVAIWIHDGMEVNKQSLTYLAKAEIRDIQINHDFRLIRKQQEMDALHIKVNGEYCLYMGQKTVVINEDVFEIGG